MSVKLKPIKTAQAKLYIEAKLEEIKRIKMEEEQLLLDSQLTLWQRIKKILFH